MTETELKARLKLSLAADDPLRSVMATILEFSKGTFDVPRIKKILAEELRVAQLDKDLWQAEAVLGDVLDLIEGHFTPDPVNQELASFAQYFRKI